MHWNETSELYKQFLLHYGRVHIKEWYLDNSNMGGGRNDAHNFTLEYIENYSMYSNYNKQLSDDSR